MTAASGEPAPSDRPSRSPGPSELRPRERGSAERSSRDRSSEERGADDTPHLDTVVFDLGNVLIRWDPAAAFHPVLDPVEVPAFLDEVGFAAWNHLQDAGRPWDEAVTDLSARYPHRAEAIASYVPNFRATLEEMPDTVAVLRELQRAKIRVLALTNWSAELFDVARAEFGFLDLFEGIVVSGEEGMAKPERELFEILLDRYAVDRGRALFVDDSVANVEAAQQVGLDAVIFTGADDFREQLRARGLLAPGDPEQPA